MCSSGVPAGWVKIVEGLLVALDDIPSWKREYVDQIKEKFAGLRFYYHEPEDGFTTEDHVRIKLLVNRAEALAWKTCEVCGTTEDVTQRSTYWVHTQCLECWEHRGERYKRLAPKKGP